MCYLLIFSSFVSVGFVELLVFGFLVVFPPFDEPPFEFPPVLGLGVSGSVTFIDLEVTIPETYCPFKTAFEELEIATFIVPVVVGVTVMLLRKF